ncbi:MAG: PHP domain-containing protein, partial [Agathobacter sp.]|nr:PHP domain-containing protein [Agathobacter sp.]
MSKTFLEVFPTLKVEKGYEGLLEKAEVTKIGANHDKSHIRIYLHAERLIPKKIIWYLEREIKNQLFPSKDVFIKIIESFRLSEQYNAESLIHEYRESMQEELNDYSLLLGNVFRTAELKFETPSKVKLVMDETIIAKTRGEEVVQFLEKIVCERCGLDFIVEVEYRAPQESKYRKNSNEQIRQQVKAIVDRTSIGKEKEAETPQEDGLLLGEDGKAVKATAGASGEKTEKTSSQVKSAPAAKAAPAQQKKPFEKKGEFRRRYEPGSKKSDNPDVIYGRDIEEEPMEIVKIDGPIGEVVIHGKVMSLDSREVRNEKTLIIFSVTDFTDTIMLKAFAKNEDAGPILKGLSPGNFVKVRGIANIDQYDGELTISSLTGIKKIPDFTTVRMDVSPEKRVELHCHTKMSDMDGVSDASAIIKRAMKWGHKAIAITDHGDVQGFTEASHTIKGPDDIKIIYGVEAYIVDDLKGIVTDSKGQSLADSYVVFDIETTGFSPDVNHIIEIGAVKVENGKIVDRFSSFVNPLVPIPYRIEELTHINDNMVIDAPTIDVVLPQFLTFCEGSVMVAHNA